MRAREREVDRVFKSVRWRRADQSAQGLCTTERKKKNQFSEGKKNRDLF